MYTKSNIFKGIIFTNIKNGKSFECVFSIYGKENNTINCVNGDHTASFSVDKIVEALNNGLYEITGYNGELLTAVENNNYHFDLYRFKKEKVCTIRTSTIKYKTCILSDIEQPELAKIIPLLMEIVNIKMELACKK